MGERRYSSRYALNFGSGWRRMVSFTPRPLGPSRRSPPTRTYQTGGWVDPRMRLDVSYNKMTAPLAIVLRLLGRPARSLVSIPTGVPRIPIIPPIRSSKENRGRGVSHRPRATDRIKMCGLCYASWWINSCSRSYCFACMSKITITLKANTLRK
jgi:hypothetical protein